jgi:S-adenosylmethionine-diacylglycerol 3-amino-3-carboxypropyl transferase
MLERARAHPITRSVVRKGSGVANRLLDHTFALAFRGLVYAQIWEDPEVDIEALQIRPDSRMVAIASGGCNVLSYLVADPQAITAVDLNTAHIALNRLKLASARHLPSHALFRRFFADADSRANIAAYREWVAPHLDDVSRRYWEGRDLTGRRRIGGFSKASTSAGCSATSSAWRTFLRSCTASTCRKSSPRRRWRSSAACSRKSWPRCSTAVSCAG